MINRVATVVMQFNILIIRKMKRLRKHNDLNRNRRVRVRERERGRERERERVWVKKSEKKRRYGSEDKDVKDAYDLLFTNCFLAHFMTKSVRFHTKQHHTTPHHVMLIWSHLYHVLIHSNVRLPCLRNTLQLSMSLYKIILNHVFDLYCFVRIRYLLAVLTPLIFLLNLINSLSFFDKW